MTRFRALYSLILRTQTTRARVVMLGVLGLLGVVIAIPLRSADDRLEAASHFIDGFGLTLVLPITTLVFASAALGDFIDDGTMVYLWMRPVRAVRSLALAAADRDRHGRAAARRRPARRRRRSSAGPAADLVVGTDRSPRSSASSPTPGCS